MTFHFDQSIYLQLVNKCYAHSCANLQMEKQPQFMVVKKGDDVSDLKLTQHNPQTVIDMILDNFYKCFRIIDLGEDRLMSLYSKKRTMMRFYLLLSLAEYSGFCNYKYIVDSLWERLVFAPLEQPRRQSQRLDADAIDSFLREIAFTEEYYDDKYKKMLAIKRKKQTDKPHSLLKDTAEDWHGIVDALGGYLGDGVWAR